MVKVSDSLSEQKSYLPIVDLLRGIAALWVCFFHFSINENVNFGEDSYIKLFGKYGRLGVEMFFVISGFIIPYSMFKAGFHLKKIHKFLFKRALRIEPPYIISILFILILAYISSLSTYYHGAPFSISLRNLWAHLGYLNVFLHEPYLNVVFWTLGIEFQYYILIGIIYYFLSFRIKAVRFFTLLIFSLITLIWTGPGEVIFSFTSVFAIGILTFQYHFNLTSKVEFLIGLGLLSGLVFYKFGINVMLISSISSLLISFFNVDFPFSRFFGKISYSLYLLHVPIGGRILNFGANFVTHPILKIIMLFVAIIITIGTSWVYYLCVEKPSLLISKKVNY